MAAQLLRVKIYQIGVIFSLPAKQSLSGMRQNMTKLASLLELLFKKW
jgi:hypothetical protein